MSSGLSVADPKYFFPAACAAALRPVVEVPLGAAEEEVAVGAELVLPEAVPYRSQRRVRGRILQYNKSA